MVQSKYAKNLDILTGIYDFNDYYHSKLEQYELIIERLKVIYDYVIVDTHSWFDVLTTDAALTLADRVIIPVKAERYSLEELKRYVKTFDSYQDFNTRKFSTLINQYSHHHLTSPEIKSILDGLPIVGYITEDMKYNSGICFKDKKQKKEYDKVLKRMGVEGNFDSGIGKKAWRVIRRA